MFICVKYDVYEINPFWHKALPGSFMYTSMPRQIIEQRLQVCLK